MYNFKYANRNKRYPHLRSSSSRFGSIKSVSNWAKLQEVKQYCNDNYIHYQNLVNTFLGHPIELGDTDISLEPNITIPDCYGNVLEFVADQDNWEAGFNQTLTVTMRCQKYVEGVQQDISSLPITINTIVDGVEVDNQFEDMVFEFNEQVEQQGMTVQQAMLNLNSAMDLQDAIADVSDKFQSNPSLAISDVDSIINSKANALSGEVESVKSSVFGASLDGKVSQYAWLNSVANILKGSSADASQGRLVQDTSRLNTIQSVLSTVLAVVGQVLSNVAIACGAIVAGIAYAISMVFNFVSSLLNNVPEGPEWDGDNDFMVKYPVMSTVHGPRWHDIFDSVEEAQGKTFVRNFGCFYYWIGFSDKIDPDVPASTESTVNMYLDISINPEKWLRYLINKVTDPLNPEFDVSRGIQHFRLGSSLSNLKFWVATPIITMSDSESGLAFGDVPDECYDTYTELVEICSNQESLVNRLCWLLTIQQLISGFKTLLYGIPVILESDRLIYGRVADSSADGVPTLTDYVSSLQGLCLAGSGANRSVRNPLQGTTTTQISGIKDKVVRWFLDICALDKVQPWLEPLYQFSVADGTSLLQRLFGTIFPGVNFDQQYYFDSNHRPESLTRSTVVTRAYSNDATYTFDDLWWFIDSTQEWSVISDPAQSAITIYTDPCPNLEANCQDGLIPVDSIARPGISIPSITSDTVKKILIIAATIVTVAFIGKKVLDRKLANKRIIKQTRAKEKVTAARKAMLANPNDQQAAKDFSKAVRRYNLKAKLKGWGSYDAANDWINEPTVGGVTGSSVASSLGSLLPVSSNNDSPFPSVNLAPVTELITGR